MAPQTLNELYVEELKDLYSAENQILKALPKMIKAATHPELVEAFATHLEQTQTHVDRLRQIFAELGEKPTGKKCKGMEGVIADGAELIDEDPEPMVLDPGLISAAQHVEHYEMAGYGSVRAWAEQLGFAKQAELLQQTLQEEKETDELLTQLAEQVVNPEADREVRTDKSAKGGSHARTAKRTPAKRKKSKSGTRA